MVCLVCETACHTRHWIIVPDYLLLQRVRGSARGPALPVALLAAVLLSSASAAAQQRPDFSGTWASAPPVAPPSTARLPGGGASDAQFVTGDMGSGWGSPLTIAQDASRLTIEYRFFSNYDLQPPLKFIYALNGSETRNSVMMGRGVQELRSTVVWTGSTLVITTLQTLPSPQDARPMTTEVRQALSLESLTSLVVETTRIGVLGGATTTTRTVYRKS